MRVISMGAGVQTTALLIKYWERYDHVIFADTGDEMPETYAYISKYIKPFCKEKQIQFLTVRSKSGLTLWEDSMQKRSYPLRMTRQCTKDHKISPIRKKLRETRSDQKESRNNGYWIFHRRKHTNERQPQIPSPIHQKRISANR